MQYSKVQNVKVTYQGLNAGPQNLFNISTNQLSNAFGPASSESTSLILEEAINPPEHDHTQCPGYDGFKSSELKRLELLARESVKPVEKILRARISVVQAELIQSAMSKENNVLSRIYLLDQIYSKLSNTHSEDRLDQFIEQRNDDVSLLLFDAEHDEFSVDWLRELGYFFTIHAKFNPERDLRNELYFHASNGGDTFSAIRLGIEYLQNPEYVDKYETGLTLLGMAAQNGKEHNIIAKLALASALKKDVRYQNPYFPDFNTNIGNILNDMTADTGINTNTDCHIINLYKDILRPDIQKYVCETLEGLMPLASEIDYHAAAHILAPRKLIGLGTAIDIEEGARLAMLCIEDTCEQKTHIDTILMPVSKNSARLNSYKTIADMLVRTVYDIGMFADTKRTLLGSIQKNIAVEEIIASTNLLWKMANQEGWPSSSLWTSLYEDCALAAGEYNPQTVMNSTLSMGPRYNPIAPNGMPVAYVYEKATSTARIDSGSPSAYSFIPPHGAAYLEDLRGYDDGSIDYSFGEIAGIPALILQEDVDVALALVFGRDTPILPSLSVETTEATQDNLKLKYNYKEWEPLWLGHTNFGRTLFYTDILAGEICWRSDQLYSLDSSSRNAQYRPQRENASPTTFFNEILRMNAYVENFGNMRVMIRPEVMDFAPTRKKDIYGSFWDVSPIPQRNTMRIDGSYKKNIDGKEVRDVALNDVNFLQGKRTQHMTDNYAEICRAFPVFERGRQLMVLYFALMKLREHWRPNEKLDREIKKNLKTYEEKPAIPMSKLIIRRFIS